MDERLPIFPIISPEFVEAAKAAHKASDAVAVTAAKWGMVADSVMSLSDALLSWHTLAAFLLGAAITYVLSKKG